MVGAGGLGSPALLYLAAAGVGRLGIIDPDVVSVSNLQRQVLFDTSRIGQPKTAAARDRLLALYPECVIQIWPEAFTAANGLRIAADFDVLLDATDNFPSRYLASDVGVWLKKPVIYGSIYQFEGQITVFAPHLEGPCYRCMFPVPPAPDSVPDCSTAGVFGMLAGLIGTLQAGEAIKLITGIGSPLLGRMLHADTLGTRFREFKLRRDPHCPVCGENPTISQPLDYELFCGIRPVEAGLEIPASQLSSLRSTYFILDVREPWEQALQPFPSDRWIPWTEVAGEIPHLPADRPILALCRMGLRSRETARLLRGHGHPRAASLAGGLEALED